LHRIIPLQFDRHAEEFVVSSSSTELSAFTVVRSTRPQAVQVSEKPATDRA